MKTLTKTQSKVLALLKSSGGKLTQVQMGKKLKLSNQWVSEVISQLRKLKAIK